MRFVTWLDRTFYPHMGDRWDDKLFRTRIMPTLTSDAIVLDLGAGAGIVPEMSFKGLARRIYGADLDPRVEKNPFIDEAVVASGERMPYPSDMFDIAFADNVLEHLDNPGGVFAEVHRVLKPGGRFFFKTPNKWHYMPCIARLTPHSLHRRLNKIRGRSEHDTFPTLYRANSVRAINRLAAKAGFLIDAIERVEGRPEYLRMSSFTYAFGILYEKLVNASPWLAPFRILIIGCLLKPSPDSSP